jgi:hypothetical protein
MDSLKHSRKSGLCRKGIQHNRALSIHDSDSRDYPVLGPGDTMMSQLNMVLFLQELRAWGIQRRGSQGQGVECCCSQGRLLGREGGLIRPVKKGRSQGEEN